MTGGKNGLSGRSKLGSGMLHHAATVNVREREKRNQIIRNKGGQYIAEEGARGNQNRKEDFRWRCTAHDFSKKIREAGRKGSLQ